jgi:hypothetical protein
MENGKVAFMIRTAPPHAGVCVAALVILTLSAEAQTPPDPGAARVVSLTGSLTVKGFRQGIRALRVNDTVQPGDELATGENSQAMIRARDGSTIIVYPDSRVIFNERSADFRELLHLFLGSIKVHIEKISGRPNPHQLSTPTAVIAVRGTTFSVFVDDTEATLVAVDEGEVAVGNIQLPGREMILRAGQRTWVRRGQPPQQAQAFRGRSERADVAAGAGSGTMGMGNTRGGTAAEMHRTQSSPGMGSMSGRTNPPH